MKIKKQKTKALLSIGFLAASFITLAGCSNNKENKLVYASNKIEFILNKDCVADISPVGTESQKSHLVAIKLKDSPLCAKKLNALISNNIGSDLYLYYNSSLVMKARIGSPINTEQGYRQTTPNKIIFDEILSAYTEL